jgi:Spx/MgsR family transcriptional regulator
MKVYGISNCNTVKKAFDWLKENHTDYEFHDYKKLGITKEKLKEWSTKAGWEQLVNKKGTTWRGLPTEQQQKISCQKEAIKLMIEKPSVIKRPVIEAEGKLLIGFDKAEYETSFKKK